MQGSVLVPVLVWVSLSPMKQHSSHLSPQLSLSRSFLSRSYRSFLSRSYRSFLSRYLFQSYLSRYLFQSKVGHCSACDTIRELPREYYPTGQMSR
jgi:hypothetical protein